jgi:hypothetical protein
MSFLKSTKDFTRWLILWGSIVLLIAAVRLGYKMYTTDYLPYKYESWAVVETQETLESPLECRVLQGPDGTWYRIPQPDRYWFEGTTEGKTMLLSADFALSWPKGKTMREVYGPKDPILMRRIKFYNKFKKKRN